MRSLNLILSLALLAACASSTGPDTSGPARCSDRNATNYGLVGDCQYPSSKPQYTVTHRNITECTVVGWEKTIGGQLYPDVYVDTTYATVLPPSADTKRVLYLQDSLGRYISGIPVKWHSSDTTVYNLNPNRYIAPGEAWAVGTLEYADTSYSMSNHIQVVAGPTLIDCK